MENKEIINLSKSIFWICFSMGSIFLVGGVLTKASGFAVGGYLLLIFGTPLNLLCVLGFLLYGMICRSRLRACVKAIGILSINIPIAVLYTVIGINLSH
ncbi:hypothetical protein [Chryseobacterium bernardetii]|uniref:hypothetical protein n=2 Tax=Chryseobacterium group TaxID=2782232 RepID=UPI001624D5AA|nr:hypothetical protein [Chryseobacterium bernardetii]MDM1557415.1 hypothetical protein [Chryseobacterium indologenes]